MHFRSRQVKLVHFRSELVHFRSRQVHFTRSLSDQANAGANGLKIYLEPCIYKAEIENCNFRKFHEFFFFVNSFKIHINHARNSRLGHNLPTPVNDRMLSPFGEGFCENNALLKFSEFTVLSNSMV